MRRLLALPLAAVALLLAGCAPTVSLRPAPEATSARCAGVIVRLPQTIGAVDRRTTDAQGTAAWGLPASVTLTCGVLTPQATTVDCVTIQGVDWLLQARTIDGADSRVLTTFGRDPGTQVVVTGEETGSVDAVLNAVSEPVAAATRTTGRRCLAPEEAS